MTKSQKSIFSTRRRRFPAEVPPLEHLNTDCTDTLRFCFVIVVIIFVIVVVVVVVVIVAIVM